jgi:hypothetical protein
LNFPARVDPLGRLRLEGRERFDAFVRTLAGKDVTLTVERRKTPKTLDQMGYYRSVVLPEFAEFCGEEDIAKMHWDLKDALLPKREQVNHLTGEIKLYVPSLADLDVLEMSNYLDACIRQAAKMGKDITPPRGQA